jgi:hypothetical protein
MRITPNVGVAIGVGISAAAGLGLVIHNATKRTELDEVLDNGTSPVATPSPRPGPAPSAPSTSHPTGIGRGTLHPDEPAWPTVTPRNAVEFPTVDSYVDRYMDAYDHSRDGVIELGWGQTFGDDERVTGSVGSIHTMAEFFRGADTDADERVTREELRSAIAEFDTRGTVGFNPNAPELGDGRLGIDELDAFRKAAIRDHSDPADRFTDRGVAQIITVDGKRQNNEGFFRALPDYRAVD